MSRVNSRYKKNTVPNRFNSYLGTVQVRYGILGYIRFRYGIAWKKPNDFNGLAGPYLEVA